MPYKQAVVFGVRRTRQERDRLTDFSARQANQKLRDLTRKYEEVPALHEVADRSFAVPTSEPARLEHKGLPLDSIEDVMPSRQHGCRRVASRMPASWSFPVEVRRARRGKDVLFGAARVYTLARARAKMEILVQISAPDTME